MQAPLLVFHGVNAPRVKVGQSETMVSQIF